MTGCERGEPCSCGWHPALSGSPAISDLTAARERHHPVTYGSADDPEATTWCAECQGTDWPCDAARFRALADELAEALRWMHETAHDFCDDPYPCSARAALAKWEASK